MSSENRYTTPLTQKSEYPDGTKDIAIASKEQDYLNPKLSPSGTLYVENIVEKGSDGFGYEIDTQNDSYYFSKELDGNTEVRYIPKNVEKVYSTTVEYKSEIKDAFAVYASEVKRFALKSMDRYKVCPKPLKKKIDNVLKNNHQYIFTEKRYNTQWNQIYIDSTTFGPYNYDSKLHVTKDIDFINDLIVVRTGTNIDTTHQQSGVTYTSKSSTSGQIVWISPHDTIAYTGDSIYTLTGEEYEQKQLYTGASGDLAEYLSGTLSYEKNYYVSNAGYCYALSSNGYRIKANQTIGSGTYYEQFGTDYYNTNKADQKVGQPISQEFYYVYDEYKNVTKPSGWNGVIPSGAWVRIESWSTNPRYIGFNGEITIKPTGASDPTLNVNYTCQGTASDLNYQQSIRKAIKQARKKFNRKVKKALVNAGIKNKTRRMQRYNDMLEKVAQNAYDGLSLVRNETVAKVQGLEANPLGSPAFYDGTIAQYGGSKMTAFYNTEQAYLDRISITGNRGGTGSSVSSGGGSSSGGSSGGGGSSY